MQKLVHIGNCVMHGSMDSLTCMPVEPYWHSLNECTKILSPWYTCKLYMLLLLQLTELQLPTLTILYMKSSGCAVSSVINSNICSHFFTFTLMTTGEFSQNVGKSFHVCMQKPTEKPLKSHISVVHSYTLGSQSVCAVIRLLSDS